MASVMNQSIQIDEERQVQEQELISRLLTENKVMLMNCLTGPPPPKMGPESNKGLK